MIENASLILGLAVMFGFFMAWAIGSNDVANAMGISVGSEVLTLRQAIVVAAIFEALGAILASSNVTSTISHGIVHVEVLDHQPVALISGMLSALLSSGLWLFVASMRGWPVSTTHTIVGAIFGFGWIAVGLEHINWLGIISIMLSWIVTPLVSGCLSYLLFKVVQKTIFDSDKPAKQAKKTVPYYVFLVIGIMMSIIFLDAVETFSLPLSRLDAWLIIGLVSLICALISYFWLRDIALHRAKISLRETYILVEQVFGLLAVVTACAMAFAHGSNDVANAIAPLAAINAIIQSGGTLIGDMAVPTWIFFLGAAGIVLGLMMYGYKVIATVGKNITDLTPSRGFVAQLATASIVVLSSSLGLPVSTTHILVGAVLGVGMARGIDAINLVVVRNIFLSWFITFPVGMILSMVFYQIIIHVL